MNIRNELFSFQLLKEQYFKKCIEGELLPYNNTGTAFDIALALQKNFVPRILITRGITFEFEYLGEFEFIFESTPG